MALGAVVSLGFLAGCTTQGVEGLTDGMQTSSIGKISSARTSHAYTAKDKECLARAMFFELNRSSREGLVAVGTVVMNRLQDGEYGDSVCEVVGQRGQFAPGVLSKKMDSDALPDVVDAAEAVLKGERHPAVKEAMFFHTAGLRFPYKNMHYVLQAGGNAFYEKRERRRMARRETDARVADAAAPQNAGAHQGVVAAAPLASNVGTQQIAMGGGATTQQVAATGAALTKVLSYEADPKAADAIGALIATQNRPLPLK